MLMAVSAISTGCGRPGSRPPT